MDVTPSALSWITAILCGLALTAISAPVAGATAPAGAASYAAGAAAARGEAGERCECQVFIEHAHSAVSQAAKQSPSPEPQPAAVSAWPASAAAPTRVARIVPAYEAPLASPQFLLSSRLRR